MNPQRTFQSGDNSGRGRISALEVDRLLTELGQLYLERFKVLRTGDYKDLQVVHDRIALIRMKLDQL